MARGEWRKLRRFLHLQRFPEIITGDIGDVSRHGCAAARIRRKYVHFYALTRQEDLLGMYSFLKWGWGGWGALISSLAIAKTPPTDSPKSCENSGKFLTIGAFRNFRASRKSTGGQVNAQPWIPTANIRQEYVPSPLDNGVQITSP